MGSAEGLRRHGGGDVQDVAGGSSVQKMSESEDAGVRMRCSPTRREGLWHTGTSELRVEDVTDGGRFAVPPVGRVRATRITASSRDRARPCPKTPDTVLTRRELDGPSRGALAASGRQRHVYRTGLAEPGLR